MGRTRRRTARIQLGALRGGGNLINVSVAGGRRGGSGGTGGTGG